MKQPIHFSMLDIVEATALGLGKDLLLRLESGDVSSRLNQTWGSSFAFTSPVTAHFSPLLSKLLSNLVYLIPRNDNVIFQNERVLTL